MIDSRKSKAMQVLEMHGMPTNPLDAFTQNGNGKHTSEDDYYDADETNEDLKVLRDKINAINENEANDYIKKQTENDKKLSDMLKNIITEYDNPFFAVGELLTLSMMDGASRLDNANKKIEELDYELRGLKIDMEVMMDRLKEQDRKIDKLSNVESIISSVGTAIGDKIVDVIKANS